VRTGPLNAVPGLDNQIISVNNLPQVHDLRGNLTKGVLPTGLMGTDAQTYSYDPRNRLTAMEGGHSFTYDVGNNRTSVTANSSTAELSVAPLGGLSQ
jgi:phage baseplate assembly protein gpV